MLIQAIQASNQEILPLRARRREAAGCQIIHDSIHRRGWAVSYLLTVNGGPAGFASIAVGGPWKDKRTAFEFYLLPEHRSRAFECFEMFLAASEAQYLEVQTSDTLLTVMLHLYGREISTESIVFSDQITTDLAIERASLRQVSSDAAILDAIAQRQGGGEWVIEVGRQPVAAGGLLFHYNRPYGDIHMEVSEPFRQRGFGAFLVQELKREAYRFGVVPAARCNPENIPSRKTLQKAGFVPCAHILKGVVAK